MLGGKLLVSLETKPPRDWIHWYFVLSTEHTIYCAVNAILLMLQLLNLNNRMSFFLSKRQANKTMQTVSADWSR